MGRKSAWQLRDVNNERNLLEGASLRKEDIERTLMHASLWKMLNTNTST